MAKKKSTAQLVDEYADLDDAVKAKEREVKSLKEDRDAKGVELHERLKEEEAGGVKGQKMQCTVGTKEYFSLDDFEEFWKYAKRNNAYDLIQRSVKQTAARDRLNNPRVKKIPGVSRGTKQVLHFSRVKK